MGHTTLKPKGTPLSLLRLVVRGLGRSCHGQMQLGFSNRTSHVLVALVLSAHQVLQSRHVHSAMACIGLVSNNPDQHTLASTHRNNRQTARDVAGAVKCKW